MTSLALLLLLSLCSEATPPPCRVVHQDVLCSNLSLRAVPADLPDPIHMLDLSRNQVENLTQETLLYRTDFYQLNLHGNRIHSIQLGLFKDMTQLKVLDLSRNRLNVLAHSGGNVGPLTSVESLDLSNNGLYTGMSDYFLADSPSLVNLSLSGNSITKISQRTFRGSSSLRRINLHNNVILEIEDGAFDFLDHLTELDLSKNSISCITDFNLHGLTVLDLSRNSIELFHSAHTGGFYRLHRLDLSQNKMAHFPLLPVNNILEHLDLSRNQLQSVNVSGSPEKKASLIFNHLRFLDMSYNQLRSIPECFFYCMASLEVLNISHNCLGGFSVSQEGVLHRVKIINLSFNTLQTLSFKDNSLQSLEKLFLQGNGLTTLDQQIFHRLSNIRFLQLQKNRLEICEGKGTESGACVNFSSVPNLECLYLSENNLRKVPSNAFVNSPLKLLDLSLNSGLEMDEDSLSGLERSLVHLRLRENNISHLNTDLSSLRSLRHVDLSTNQLRSLPTWNQESSIESLNLQNNNLVALDYRTMVALERSLKTLYMGSNPLSCCRNLGFLHMVQRSAVVVPDIETVTCVHRDHSEPVNIEKVTEEMCQGPDVPRYMVIIVVVMLLCAVVTIVLLVRTWHLRKLKRRRSFSV
ncbi:transforming growth factor beta activator LRRC32 [Gouania willdenowi]|uniref:Leucine rich repeat containing 32 n=1 Tax=Gouania willdenowi TaxID=441366 RepID=A0A8C5DWZ6_GOUWI|nr:transforming growth factor beta activator LRRC32 [Gouania willdenowi]XP_028323223.1 transforming growth factor beta activator LRRC32 [Gouania willdenowi]XP_028323224.1 transforming growth factor beta activator LRRC32 [Gouania willdenowi]